MAAPFTKYNETQGQFVTIGRYLTFPGEADPLDEFKTLMRLNNYFVPFKIDTSPFLRSNEHRIAKLDFEAFPQYQIQNLKDN